MADAGRQELRRGRGNNAARATGGLDNVHERGSLAGGLDGFNELERAAEAGSKP